MHKSSNHSCDISLITGNIQPEVKVRLLLALDGEDTLSMWTGWKRCDGGFTTAEKSAVF